MKKSFSLLLFFLLSSFLLAQSEADQRLLQKIKTFDESPHLKHASWSITVKNLFSGTYEVEHNSERALSPASTFKLVTTGAALEILGKDYQYKTQLYYTGTLDTTTGVLNGDIIIKGGGDPSLGSQYFEDQKDSIKVLSTWVAVIKDQLLIKEIKGGIVADAGAFEKETTPPSWIWGDMGNYYGAGPCGLSFMDNLYRLHFRSGRPGTTTKVTGTTPEIPEMIFDNQVTANGSSDNAYIFGAPYSYQRTITGTIPPNRSKFTIKGSIPDPAWFCAYSLEKDLKEHGIKIAEAASTYRLSPAKEKEEKNLIHSYHSPTLDSIIYFINIKSNNLFAEHVLKTISMEKNGRGTLKGGTQAIESFWKSKGIDLTGFNMLDGSGLSRANSITTQQQVEMLTAMAKSESFENFYKSLPIAGKSGTLKNMCKGTIAAGNVHAKSGYLTRVRGYTGYVKNKKGELLAFSMLANNYSCSASQMKKMFEELMVLLAQLD